MVSTVQKIRKSGNSLVVTIPKEIVEQLGLAEGMSIRFSPEPVEIEYKSIMAPEWKESAERVINRHSKSLEFLRDN